MSVGIVGISGVWAAAGLNEELDGSFGMEAEIDVEQPGQEALHVQLRPHPLINQVLEFLGVQRRASCAFTLEFTLVKCEHHYE